MHNSACQDTEEGKTIKIKQENKKKTKDKK
jgi:hypothetical protein